MRRGSAFLFLAFLVSCGTTGPTAALRANVADELPNTIEWKTFALEEWFDVTSLRYLPGREVIWNTTALIDIKDFKGIRATFLDEDGTVVVKRVLEFQPNREEYHKKDKVRVSLKLPNKFELDRTQRVVLERNKGR